MSKFDDLQKEFENKIRNLQNTCQHEKTHWATEWWTVGHETGDTVEVCDECHKILNRKKMEE